MKFPRFTTRHLLSLIALADLALGFTAWMERRAVAFRALADFHAERSRQVSYACRINSKLLEYHEALAGKYKTAAERPWMPVEPDAPEPE
jgi:hypothetical protein